MALEVKFFTSFNKRDNSTKVPSGKSQSFMGEFFEGFSILSPVIRFNNGVANVGITTCEYAQIPIFGRYYHVTDWSYESGLWICSMEVDDLASFKTQILATSAYIMYATSGYNANIVDNRLSCPESIQIANNATNLLTISETGTYVLQTVCKDTTPPTGGTGCYYLNAYTFGQVLEAMGTDEVMEQMNQFFSGAAKNGLVCANWLPFSTETLGLISGGSVVVGQWDSGISAHLTASPYYTTSTSVPIPWVYDDFRRSSQFCKLVLWLPFIGQVELNIELFRNAISVLVGFTMDLVTGDFTYIIKGNEGHGEMSMSGSCGASIPISTVQTNWGGFGSTVMGALGSAVTANAGGTVTGVFNAVGNLMTPITTNTGGYTGRSCMAYDGNISCTIYQKNTSDNPADMASTIGRPVYSVGQLSDYTGYVQTVNASVAAGFESETKRINSMLDGGIYIE